MKGDRAGSSHEALQAADCPDPPGRPERFQDQGAVPPVTQDRPLCKCHGVPKAANGRCVVLQRESQRRYREANREKINEAGRLRYDSDKQRERYRRYYAENRESELLRRRAYREAHYEELREKARLRAKKNREADPEKHRLRNRLYYAADPEKHRRRVREYRETHFAMKVGGFYMGSYPVTPEQKQMIQEFRAEQRASYRTEAGNGWID